MQKKKPVEKTQEEIFDNFFSPSSDEEDQVKNNYRKRHICSDVN